MVRSMAESLGRPQVTADTPKSIDGSLEASVFPAALRSGKLHRCASGGRLCTQISTYMYLYMWRAVGRWRMKHRAAAEVGPSTAAGEVAPTPGENRVGELFLDPPKSAGPGTCTLGGGGGPDENGVAQLF
jgi:hypothetical protein